MSCLPTLTSRSLLVLLMLPCPPGFVNLEGSNAPKAYLAKQSAPAEAPSSPEHPEPPAPKKTTLRRPNDQNATWQDGNMQCFFRECLVRFVMFCLLHYQILYNTVIGCCFVCGLEDTFWSACTGRTVVRDHHHRHRPRLPSRLRRQFSQIARHKPEHAYAAYMNP